MTLVLGMRSVEGESSKSTKSAPKSSKKGAKSTKSAGKSTNAYEELEVRCGDQAYAMNLSSRTCSCKLWQLSGMPCIHAIIGYMYLTRDTDEGVHFSYIQEVWARTYQHFIRPVPGTSLWKRTNNQPPLPLIVRKMPRRTRKKRVKAVGENNSQVTRLGKHIRCSNCQGVGHNKASCDNPSVPKPITIVKKVPGRRREPNVQYASARGRGRGSRGRGRGTMGAESGGIGTMGAESSGRGPMDAESGGRGTMGAESSGRGSMGSSIGAMGTDSGGRVGGRGGGRASMGGARGRRGGARGRRGYGIGGRRGGGRGSTSGLKLMEEDDIRKTIEDEYMQDEEALQQSREEEHMFERMDIEREREEKQWEAMLDPLNDYKFPDQEESMDPINFMVNTQESITQGPSVQRAASIPASVQAAQSEPAFAEGLSVQPAPSVHASDNATKKKGKKNKE
ncbi:zinc finger, PMZ-type containing protein [Tanacetum coccineum]